MRKAVALFLAVLLAAHVALAGDPWKEKPYTAWTLEDVQKILGESPWAKVVTVEAAWLKGEPHFLQGMAPGCGGRPDLNKPMRTPSQWVVGTPSQSIVAFQVTWDSAKTMRAAKLRLAVLCGTMDQEDTADILEREDDSYTVTISAPDMTPFDGISEEDLLANTYLMLKTTKQRLAPSNVVIAHGFDRKTVFRLTFEFPKKTDSGAPTILPDEKEIELVSTAGKTVLKTKFQPPKMLAKTAIDF
ncbi:MAG: hypothetical protein HY234_11075 [Acidobacteria bacterium]|nr:hypothetical protein [Acidobacteriota bacterium]